MSTPKQNQPMPEKSQDKAIEQTSTAKAEPKKVAFQFDRDTTLLAKITRENKDGTVDLRTITDPTGYFKTNVSSPAQMRDYQGVRKGSPLEEGTYFDIPSDYQDKSVGEKLKNPSNLQREGKEK